MSAGSPPHPRDQAAFAALYRRTARVAWNVLGRAGIGRKAEREELLQDVYVVAHTKLPSRNPAVPEASWVASIAWYVARDYLSLRRVQKEQPVPDPDAVEEPIADSASPEEIAHRRRAYRAAVDGLDFDDRVVLEMHEIDGYEVPEIARALAIPEGTARTRLRRARQDMTAAATRMQAREAHALGRTAMPMILPFGVGAWREVSGLFDDAPPDLADALWPAVSRAVVRNTAVGAASGIAAAAAAKATTGAAFGAGTLVGGGVVGAAALALRLLTPAPAPLPAPERAPVAVITELPAASVGSATATPTAAPATTIVTTTATVSAGGSPPVGIDPEELRLYQQALAASRQHDFDAAAAALDEHARRFPRGALAKDRERMRADIIRARAAARAGAPDAGGPHRLFGSDE